MKKELKEKFISLWRKYFNTTELPITFYYSEGNGNAKKAEQIKGWGCLICELKKVFNGEAMYYTFNEIKCAGAKRYLGYTNKVNPDFEYFLSCGIPGKMEGERYKQNPELVLEMQKQQQTLPVNGKNIVFKRWDMLEDSDNPDVVIFFAKGEVLSGLFTLANFDTVGPNDGVIAPFGAGCGSIIHFPYLEIEKDNPRAVIGLFDPSARPCVPIDILSFAVPMKKFEKMIGYMEESFLITKTWEKVKKRMK